MPEFGDAERSVLADGHRGADASATSAAIAGASDDDRADVARPLGRPAAAAAADPHRRRAEARAPPWPTLLVAPREAPGGRLPRVGHRAPALRGAVTMIVAATTRMLRRRGRAARHRARHRAVAHGAADRDRERLRVLDAQRGAVGAQRAVARAGARGGRRRGRAHGVRAVAAALPDAWTPDGAAARVDGRRRRRSSRTAVDESAKIDLNAAPRGAAEGPARCSVGGARRRTRRRASSTRSLDWRDPDDLRRPNGAEEADYRAAGLKYKPANAPFETVGELARVLGVTPALYARIADSLTVHSRQPGINAADRVARRAARAAQRDAGSGRRLHRAARTTRSRRSCRCRRSRRRRASAPARCRCGASAPRRRLPDGVTFVREAVVRPSRRRAPSADRARLAGRRPRSAAPRVAGRGRHDPTPTAHARRP